LAQAIRTSRGALAAAGLFSVFGNLSTLLIPLYMIQVFTRVLPSQSESTLVMLTLIIAFLLLFFTALDMLRGVILARISNRIDTEINPSLFNATFERGVITAGGSTAQVLRDLDSVRQFVGGRALFTFFDLPWVPLLILVLFLFDPLVGWIGTIAGLILFGLALVNELQTRRSFGALSQQAVVAQDFADAALRNAEAVKAMGMLPQIRARWHDKHYALIRAQTQANERTAVILGISKFARMMAQVLVMAAGVYLVIEQRFLPVEMIASMIIMGRALMPVEQAVSQWSTLGRARAASKRIRALLENMPAQAPEQMTLPRPQGRVQVEQVIASPPGQQAALLKQINLELAPGDSLGIFGPSGAGKSTLARLLVGIWPVRSGAVRLDGVDVFDWRSEELGRYIGYLPQDVELFDGTVAENIARFQEAEPEAVVRAARLAGAHELILHLPEGYDTLLGRDGLVLSGGQRQRVGLARALFGQPALVILDEPNASLDTEGDQALLRALSLLKRQGVTTIVIAHRPNLLRAVDQLLWLRDGVIAQLGPREQVLKSLQSPTLVSNQAGATTAKRLARPKDQPNAAPSREPDSQPGAKQRGLKP
jgi:PrtD family type I secretion system ABC transporter